MSQSWNVPILAGDKVSSALLSKVNDALEALRTNHSGAAPPATAKVAYMLAADTALGVMVQRDAGDTVWTAVFALNAKNHQDEPQITIPGIAGSVNLPLYAPGQAWSALELAILSDVTTAGSTGVNNWQFDVYNRTQAVALYSTAPDTNGGGGSPGELVQYVPWVVTFDQNQATSANDYLELQITQNGAPTSLAAANVIAAIRGTLVGA